MFKLLVMMLSFTLLTACARPKPSILVQTEYLTPQIPPVFLIDHPLPDVPHITVYDEKAHDYVVDLWKYAVQCKIDKQSITRELD